MASYSAPTVATSGASFSQLQAAAPNALLGLLALLAGHDSLSPQTTAALAGGPTGASGAWNSAAAAISSYLAGSPVDQQGACDLIEQSAAVFRAIAQGLDDAGALIAANPGTLSTVAGPAPSYTLTVLRTF
jgi:hypothetical protein